MAVNFIYVYYNFTYFLLLSPYRFQRTKLGNFSLVEWLPQKILCGVNTFLIISVYVSKTYQGYRCTTVESLISILVFFEFISCLICKSLLFFSIWWKKTDVLQILNAFYYDPYLKSLNKSSWNNSVPLIASWLVLYIIVAISRICCVPSQGISSILPKANINVDSFSIWYTHFKTEANDSVLWNLLFARTVKEDNESILNLVILVIIAFSFFSKAILAYLADIVILIFVLTLRTPVKEFSTQLKGIQVDILEKENAKKAINSWVLVETSRAKLDLAVQQYESLKVVSNLINSFIGPILLFYLGEVVFTYGLHFKNTIYQGTYVLRIVVALFYICTVCVFCFGADIPRQLEHFKEWLFKNRRHLMLENNEAMFLLNSLERNAVAISACGVFTLTYSMIGTILSTELTFLIISLQSPAV